MAQPKFRTSKARGRRRRAVNMKLAVPTIVECRNCGNKIMLHRVCPKCGFYRGKQILEPKDMN
jgi:large subunit ribosomal protein L32